MPVNPASVTQKSLRLESPTGVLFDATTVSYNALTGEAVFSYVKPYVSSDDGDWSLFTGIENRISDIAGNLVIGNQRLATIEVSDLSPLELAELKAKQDAQAESIQRITQSVADLAVLVAGGAGSTLSTEVKTIQSKLTALDTAKADKTELDALDATVTALKTALADGATDKEVEAAISKVDAAIAAIELNVKTLVGRTLYTTTQTINAIPGDSVYIDLAGDIQLPSAPPDGSEVRIFDPLALIKIGRNNVLPGLGDRIGALQGTIKINDPSPLAFDKDNQLLGGFLRLKYQQSMRSWNVWVVYGAPIGAVGEEVNQKSIVQHDAAETVPLPISSKPSVQFHLEGGGGAWIDTELPNGWWGTIINTTSAPQPISFDDDDLMVFLRDGGALDLIESPYELAANSVVTLQMVENGFKFLQIIPHGGGSSRIGGDRTESVSLGTLLGGTWTPFPAATGEIKDFKIFDLSGNDVSSMLETRRTVSGWEVFSLVRQDNLVFEYEIAQAGDSKIEKVVLPLLTANRWTNLPAAKGAIADYKVFDSGVDISGLLDFRRINGVYQVHSLVDKVNLQFEYEIGA